MRTVVESYPQLWHYTTGPGLHGILTSQQLWATNILYLNDAEEFTGFFDHKLLALLKEGVRDGLEARKSSGEVIRAIDDAGGIEGFVNIFSSQFLDNLRTNTLNLKAYIASFCYTPSAPGSEDGLLSQWRGYGVDGGYAIVFDTQGLNDLLHEEKNRFFYSYGCLSAVDYHDCDTGELEEARDWENAIRKTVAHIIHKQPQNPAEALYEPIVSLATRHKHRGFREECEVRIAVVPLPRDNPRKAGDNRPEKQVYFNKQRGGGLVPYIALFERTTGEAAKLPIKKIIVGPHPEKLKRQKAIEMLLDQLEIEAKVEVSDIPYIGR